MLSLASLSALLFFVSYLWAADAVAPQTLRYTIQSNGQTAGNEVDTYSPRGQIDCTFEFNDRGRGPKIVAHYLAAADGLPLLADVTGNDYWKAASRNWALEPLLSPPKLHGVLHFNASHRAATTQICNGLCNGGIGHRLSIVAVQNLIRVAAGA